MNHVALSLGIVIIGVVVLVRVIVRVGNVILRIPGSGSTAQA